MTSNTEKMLQNTVTKSAVQDQPLIVNTNNWTAKAATSSQNTINNVESSHSKAANQIKPVKTGTSTSNLGLLRTISQGVRSNGFLSLYGGISAGLQRQGAFFAVRIGLYDSVKGFYHKLMPGMKKTVPNLICL